MAVVNSSKCIAGVVIASALVLSGCAGNSLPGWMNKSFGNEKVRVEEHHIVNAELNYRLALQLMDDSDGKADYKAAAEALERSARGGHLQAQYLLGKAYQSGTGVWKDHDRARQWFELAAAKGHISSQYALGDIFVNGRGTPAEPEWAAQWFGRAADQGDGRAQYKLAVAYAAGIGLAKDIEQAWFWLLIAERNGYAEAKPLSIKLAANLTAEQQRLIKAKANRWWKRTPETTKPKALVRFIQSGLNAEGFSAGPEDGLMGQKTRSAIRAFNQQAGRGNSSVIDSVLLEMLRAGFRARG